MQEGKIRMNLCYLLLLIVLAPFVIFFCSKWGAFGWFRGKKLAENGFQSPLLRSKKPTRPDITIDNRTMNDI